MKKKITKFSKLTQLKAVDFRSKKRYSSLETVDFRSKKLPTILETFLGSTPDHKQQVFSGRRKYQPDPEFEKSMHDHYHDHDETHNKAIRAYTGSQDDKDDSPGKYGKNKEISSVINSHLFLKKGKPEEHHKQIGHLDDVTGKHKAPHDFHVYSGLHAQPAPGDVHEHHGFMSTSLDPEIAGQFAKSELGPRIDQKDKSFNTLQKDQNHVLKLKIEKGSKHGYYVGARKHLTNYHNEREFVLGRGKKIHIHPEPEIHTENRDWDYPDGTHRVQHVTHIWHGRIVDK